MHNFIAFSSGSLAQRSFVVVLAAFGLVLLQTDVAYAQIGAGFLCDLVNNLFYLGIAPGIATLGVIGIGVAATFGKVSWGMAVLVAVGIAAIFGAGTIAAGIGEGCLPPTTP